MGILSILILCLIAWVLLMAIWWGWVVPKLRRGPTGRAGVGLAWRLSKWLVRWRHHARVDGVEHLHTLQNGPLIIVANHTGAIDPLLIQATTDRTIRWMMARDLMHPDWTRFWSDIEVIPVDRSGMDAASLRTALRTLRDGGCIGVFPEGRITRPPGTIRPFMEGVGLLAGRSGANVLPCWISGTPDVDGLMASLLGASCSRVRMLEPARYDKSDTPDKIAADLRSRIAQASGWPVVDDMMPLHLG